MVLNKPFLPIPSPPFLTKANSQILRTSMLAAHSPDVSTHHQLIQCPKSGGVGRRRPPLQPKNLFTDYSCSTPLTNAKPLLNHQRQHSNLIPSEIVIFLDEVDEANEANKENVPPIYSTPAVKKVESLPMEAMDISLADELSAIRSRVQRVKMDREKTEKLLEERGRALDLQMKNTLNRGEVQKQLEMELDRLYRLKEIKLACQKIPPVRSLRDKEVEKKMNK